MPVYAPQTEGNPVEAMIVDPRWISTKAAFGWHALLPSATNATPSQLRKPSGPMLCTV